VVGELARFGRYHPGATTDIHPPRPMTDAQPPQELRGHSFRARGSVPPQRPSRSRLWPIWKVRSPIFRDRVSSVILDPLRLLGGPLLAAVMGGLIVHFATRRRDAENERRKQRIDYLLKAYRTLAHLAHRQMSQEQKRLSKAHCRMWSCLVILTRFDWLGRSSPGSPMAGRRPSMTSLCRSAWLCVRNLTSRMLRVVLGAFRALRGRAALCQKLRRRVPCGARHIIGSRRLLSTARALGP
jgi:hypothetical protein